MNESLNPYAAPRSSGDDLAMDGDVPWRMSGRMLIARKGVTLPAVCIFTGQPAPGEHERRSLSWTPTWFKVMGGLIPIIAAFAYTMFRRSGELEYALGPLARKRRRAGTTMGLVGCGTAIGLFVLGIADELPGLSLAGFLLFLVAFFVASARARLFHVNRIDDRYLYIELTPAAAQALAALQ
jgi:hypothetical protein